MKNPKTDKIVALLLACRMVVYCFACCKNDKEEARITYLKSLHMPWAFAADYFDNMTLEELNKEVVKAALYQQQKDMER